MNQDFEKRLRESLAEQNDSIEIEGAGPTAAASRAAARSHHVGLGRGIAAMVVVACLGAMAFSQFSNSSTENLVTTNDEQAAPDGETESAEGSDEDRVAGVASVDFEADLVEGSGQFFDRFLTDEGQLIQVTTRPGLESDQIDYANQSFVVMVSDSNGVVETNDVPEGVNPTSVTYYDGVLYSVSTSPKSVNDGSDVVFSKTTDNGKSWDSNSIELGPVSNPEIASVWRSTSVAASDAGILVSVQSSYWIDFSKLLPQYSYEKGNFELRQTPEGVDVRDWTQYQELSEEQSRECDPWLEELEEPTDEDYEAMEDCWSELDQLPEPEVIDSYTWEQLGIEPIEAQNTSQMFLTTDGKNFEEVSSPSKNASPYVVANANGFIAEAYPEYDEYDEYDEAQLESEYAPTWFASSDGRSWAPVSVPAGTCSLNSSSSETVIAQSCTDRLQVHVSTDNGTSWNPLAPIPEDAPEDHATYVSIFGGDLGFVAYRSTEPDYSLVEEQFEKAMESGASDEELMALESEFFGSSSRQLDVLFSKDGQTWSLLDLPAEIVGADSWGNEATVGANHIVLTIVTSNEDGYKVRNVFLSPS